MPKTHLNRSDRQSQGLLHFSLLGPDHGTLWSAELCHRSCKMRCLKYFEVHIDTSYINIQYSPLSCLLRQCSSVQSGHRSAKSLPWLTRASTIASRPLRTKINLRSTDTITNQLIQL